MATSLSAAETRITRLVILSRPYLPVAVLSGVLIAHAVHLAVVTEDAHITFRFARNLAQGHGFVWNVGEPPIEGFTTFLWVLVAAAGFLAGLDVFWLTQSLGTLAAVGTLLLTFELARRRMAASNWVALVPCVLLASSGPLATWAASGMEMTTFGFFVLLGVFAYLTHLQRPARRWLVLSSLALCTATLLRPEGALVFAVLAAMSVTLFWDRTRSMLGDRAVWVLAYALPLGLFLAWRLNEFGDPLPNTFYQKTGGGLWQHLRGIGYLINFAFYYLLPITPFFAVLAWEAGFPDIRRIVRPGVWVRLANTHEAAVTCGVLALAWMSAMVYVGGDYMAMYRFMVPILPLFYLMLVPALQRLLPVMAGAPGKVRFIALLVVLASLATVFHSTRFESSFFRVATWQMGNYRGVQSERRYVERFSLIGRFFEGYAKSGSESLATRSIGSIGYYGSRLAIHDLNGLTDRHISRVPARATNQGWAGHEKWDLDYSFGRLPTYFMLDENLAATDVAHSARRTAAEMADAITTNYPTASRYADWIRANPEFIERNYRLVTVRMDDRVNDEEGYFAFLERTEAP